MKKIIIATIAFVLFTVCAYAQKNEHANGKMKSHHIGKGMHKGKIADALNMDDAQKSKIKEYNNSFKIEMKNLKSNDAMTLGEFKQKKEILKKQRKSNIDNIYTPEQKKKLDEMKQHHAAKKAEHHEKKLSKLIEKINLTDAQVATIQNNRNKNKETIEAIKNDNTLTKDQQKEKIKAIKENEKVNFEKSLTEEQKKKFAEMKMQKENKNNRKNKKV